MLKTKRLLLPLILIICLAFSLIGYSANLYGTYDQRIKFTVDHTKIDSDVTWFPVTVSLTSGQGEEVFAEFDADADFDKVCFTKDDGVTPLFAECELFDDSEQKAIYHVSTTGWVLDDDVDTDFYMYYDNDYTEPLTKQGTVISPTGAYYQAAEPSVIHEGNAQVIETEDDVFKMWYRVYDGSNCDVFYAESTDGESWTQYGSNPVLTGEFHACPFVFYDSYDTCYYMYVHGAGWTDIDKYSSADGLSWSKDKDTTLTVGAGGQWDDIALGNVFVWKEGETDWRMLYDAYGTPPPWSIGYATSSDGETWSKSGSNPVLTNASSMRGSSELHKIDSTYYLFHTISLNRGTNPTTIPTEISYSTSTNLTSWTEWGGNPFIFRTTAGEGVDDNEGQVADVSIVEVDGNTYFFYDAVPEQSPGDDHTIALATSSLSLAEIVQTPGMNHTGAIGSPQAKFVWDDYYDLVNHHTDETTSTVLDSTFENNDGAKKDVNEPVEATGQVAQGQSFDGSDDYIRISDPSMDFGTGGLTLEVIGKTANEELSRRLMYRQDSDTDHYPIISLYITTAGNINFYVRGLTNYAVPVDLTSDTANYDDNNFHYIAGVFDDAGGTGTIYTDGSSDGSQGSKTTTDVNFGEADLAIGQYYQGWVPGSGHFMKGVVDELRISATPRSAAWIAATYDSLWDTLLTYGDEEAEAVSGGTSILYLLGDF